MSDIDLPRLIKLSNEQGQEQTQSSFFVNTDVDDLSGTELVIDSDPGKLKSLSSSPQPTKKKCFTCNRRLNLTTEFQCKCDQQFCLKHRYPDMHSCQFNHKAIWKKSLESKNPAVCYNKIEKI